MPYIEKAGIKKYRLTSVYVFATAKKTVLCQTDDLLPIIKEIRNRIKKIKNKTFAIEAAPAAMPPNPNTAAMIATIRNITVQRSIIKNF